MSGVVEQQWRSDEEGAKLLMAPLWKTMLSKSSPLYRDALFSFSLWEWKAQEREVLLLKKAGERERKAMLTQIHK